LKVIVLFGPPGAGKGTQAGLLASRLGAKHLSTGSLLREQIACGSSLGLRIKGIVESGRLVGDEVLFEALDAELGAMKGSSESLLVLDGVPRTESQVELLDASLERVGASVHSVLYISAPVQKLVERFARRWTCRSCGNVFSFGSVAEAEGVACSSCGTQGSMYRRVDDAPEAVERRFRVYEEETLPVVSKYRLRNLVFEIDGLQSPELVYARVAAEVVLK
jgi:adenylate kinase